MAAGFMRLLELSRRKAGRGACNNSGRDGGIHGRQEQCILSSGHGLPSFLHPSGSILKEVELCLPLD